MHCTVKCEVIKAPAVHFTIVDHEKTKKVAQQQQTNESSTAQQQTA